MVTGRCVSCVRRPLPSVSCVTQYSFVPPPLTTESPTTHRRAWRSDSVGASWPAVCWPSPRCPRRSRRPRQASASSRQRSPSASRSMTTPPRSGSHCRQAMLHAMRTPCARHAHAMRTPCARHAHAMRTPCARHAHAMRTPCARHAHAMRTPCARGALRTPCARGALRTPCARHAHAAPCARTSSSYACRPSQWASAPSSPARRAATSSASPAL